MANKEDWLRGFGGALTAGVEQHNKNRVMGMEQEKIDSANRNADRTFGLEEEKLASMNTNERRRLALDKIKHERMIEMQEGRTAVMDTRNTLMETAEANRETAREEDRKSKRILAQENAIDYVQKRMDSVIEPGDMEASDYMRSRDTLTKQAADMDPEDLKQSLKQLQDDYLANRALSLDPSTEEGKRRLKELERHTEKINDIVDTGNKRLKRAFGDDFEGSIKDYLFIGNPQAMDPEAVIPPEPPGFNGASEDSGGIMDVFSGINTPPTGPSRAEREKSGAPLDTGINRLVPGIKRYWNEGNVRPPGIMDPDPATGMYIDPNTGDLRFHGDGQGAGLPQR